MLDSYVSSVSDRSQRIQNQLRTNLRAMPENKGGKLDHAPMTYALHKYFVQRHGWYVRGLFDVGVCFQGHIKKRQERVEEIVQSVS